MTSLTAQHCEACHVGAPMVTEAEKQQLHQQIPEWELIWQGAEEQLKREFTFKDFATAWLFTNKVAELAEAQGHHPALLLEYGKVTVRWWTHKIGGLHRNDFIMAARTDQLL